ncbi:pescadillo homolog [Lineus longissimus]|uniref:pescadillo homolog n=1 Tax=Lineus longissimus TaxID=88925 RepID=UPI002B4F4035
MGRPQKKYEKGAATAYIARNQALKKLQLSLPDFRRLCILKGIYPHEPKHKKKVGKGSTAAKTYYFYKDIQFLLHEPIVNKFRAFKIFVRKLKKALAKNEGDRAKRLRRNKPKYKLDHIVRERYPSFIDALRDLEDCLSMCFLFAGFPKTRKTHSEVIQLCRRLSVEFLHYCIAAKALRKVFISIKGIYYQVEIMGQTLTWIVPHKLGHEHPTDVDYRIMATFVEFYTTMLGFINFRLYHTLNLHYPPKLDLELDSKDPGDLCSKAEQLEERLAAMTQSLAKIGDNTGDDDDANADEFPSVVSDDPDVIEQAKVEQEKMTKFLKLFKGVKCFVNREVPREALTFVIRSFGGQVSWHKTMALGATFEETDESITHQIVDRPEVEKQYLSRYYIQPQWIFDCINARKLLPVEDYFPGVTLPPHLSPFVEETEDDYVPPEKLKLMGRQTDSEISNEESGEGSSDEEDELEGDDDDEEEDLEQDDDDDDDDSSDDEEDKSAKKRKTETNDAASQPSKKREKKDLNVSTMSVEAGEVEVEDIDKKLKKQMDEERRLGEMMIPKKHRRLYKKIMHSKKKKAQEVKKLKEKREEYEKTQRIERKKKKSKA